MYMILLATSVALTLVAYSDRLISDKLANKLAKFL